MKLPKEAKLVFKGKIFDVYQWEQKMFDGSYATFEMLKRPDTLQIIAIQGDKIFLAYESQPRKDEFYSLFGGRAEEGEEPLETAKRELSEESGLVSEDWELYKAEQPLTKIDWTVYVYIARNCKKNSEPKLDAGEKIEIKNFSFDEFVNIVDSDQFRGKEIKLDILRMKLDRNKMEEFKSRLFK